MVEFSYIIRAYDRIKTTVNYTPICTSRTLDHILNAHVFLKCENFQRVGAFKFRGAFNALSQLPDHLRQAGVITHSSGNHAQALALAAQIQQIPATIVMPKNSPQVKVNATRDTYGATVVLCENTLQSRETTTAKLMAEHGYTLIHPYDNDHIITGAGTAAYELLTTHPNLDLIITPVGGGGLLSGTALASKGMTPKIQVYGGEPIRANDAYRSLQTGTIQVNDNPDTIADGLRTNLCPRTFEIIQKHVTAIITVSETAILQAMQFLWERMKLIVEPSGAVPLAALLSQPDICRLKNIGIIISGGNIDLTSFFQLLSQQIHE
jgi:threonine dehydratase